MPRNPASKLVNETVNKAPTGKAGEATGKATGAAGKATGAAGKATDTAGKATEGLGLGGLSGDLQHLAGSAAELAMSAAVGKLGGLADRLQEYADKGGGTGLVETVTGTPLQGHAKNLVKGAAGSGVQKLKDKLGKLAPRKGGGKKPKVTNIVETVDVGVPVRLAYDQWTRFTDFPSFAKKVENVGQQSDEKLIWRAKIFWSRREWESTIVEQVPDKRIVWRSKGAKGSVDGAVTFHELAPELTRIVLVLEYHPKGLFEHTGNLWRAQGRRARLELKHFQRHAMTRSILHPDEVEGWRGEIHDGEVAKDHAAAMREEQEERGGQEERGEQEERKDSAGKGSGTARPRRRTARSASSEGDGSRPPRRSRASSDRTATRSEK